MRIKLILLKRNYDIKFFTSNNYESYYCVIVVFGMFINEYFETSGA